MALDAIVTDLSAVPEALHSEYQEKDGKFYLQVKAVDGWDLQDIGGLTSTVQAERNLKKQLEKQLAPFKGLDPETARTAVTQLAAFDGLTPDEAKALKTEIEGLRAAPKGAKVEDQVAAALTAAKAEYERTLGARQTELQSQIDAEKASAATLKAQLKGLLVDNQIKGEVAKARIVAGLEDAVELLLKTRVQPIEVDGKIAAVVVGADGSPDEHWNGTAFVPKTIADLIAEMRTAKPAFFQADAPSGTGIPVTSGSPAAPTGKNPWSKEHFNRTEQVLMKKNNPKQAAQMMAAAGVAV